MAVQNLLKSITVGTLLIVAPILVTTAAQAQFVPSKESLSELYPGKAYSP